MTDITINQLDGTYSPVSFYKRAIDTNYAKDESSSNRNSLFLTIYHTLANTSSFSQLTNLFGDNYSIPEKRSDSLWLTHELKEYLARSTSVSLASLEYLLTQIYIIFGDVKIETIIHNDPEEGWAKLIVKIHSEIQDLDDLMKREDHFFIKAESDSRLLSILPHVIISQA
ncbi:MAG: hypothetical protein A4S08_06685 [Proteobacteria bacterium SG_bin4]|nr:MAG: hypothetical protein A4S08_06685 [Proteobacteria bacterium SG_bin4]